MKKENLILRASPTDSDFGKVFFFSFSSLKKSCKTAVLAQKWEKKKKKRRGEKLAEIIFKITDTIFPKFFSKKSQIFLRFVVLFRGVISASRKEKNVKKKMSRPTDWPYLKGPSSLKQGFFFFFGALMKFISPNKSRKWIFTAKVKSIF